jgi:hypothetical protein
MLARQQKRFSELLFRELFELQDILNRADAELGDIDSVERVLATGTAASIPAGFTTLQALAPP